MTLYSLSVRSENILLAASPVLEIIAGATEQLTLVEMTISACSLGGANSAAVGLGRPAAIGVSPVDSGYRFGTEGTDSYVPASRVATRWGTPPTVPANFFRRFNQGSALNGATGQWRFRPGLVIAPAASLVLWCIAGSGANNAPTFDDVSIVVNL